MINQDLNNYLKAINSSKNIPKIKLAVSKRKQVLEFQKGKCSECKKELKNFFSKYIEDPKTNQGKIICSNCAIKIPKRESSGQVL